MPHVAKQKEAKLKGKLVTPCLMHRHLPNLNSALRSLNLNLSNLYLACLNLRHLIYFYVGGTLN